MYGYTISKDGVPITYGTSPADYQTSPRRLAQRAVLKARLEALETCGGGTCPVLEDRR